MHRWLSICTATALVMFSQTGFSQEAASAPESSPAADFPGSKHRLKPSPTQALQVLIEQQSKVISDQTGKIDQQTKLIEDLTKQGEQQGKVIDDLGKQVEKAGKQTENLNAQVSHLTQLLEDMGSRRHPASTTATVPSSAPENTPAAEPSQSNTEKPTVRAEPVVVDPDAPTHVVKRGENLISIAHQHGITVAELLKFNKIGDERKLQIGQTLLLPKPATAASSPQPPKDTQ